MNYEVRKESLVGRRTAFRIIESLRLEKISKITECNFYQTPPYKLDHSTKSHVQLFLEMVTLPSVLDNPFTEENFPSSSLNLL